MPNALGLLAPKGLWLLTLLAPLVVLYILKVRRPRQRLSSVWLWAESKRDLLARSPFKRLVPQIPLLLQALAVALLALAAARPASRGRAVSGDHVAIVVDTSASMATVDAGGVRRIDRAKEAARQVVSSLAPGTDALLLDAGRDAVVALAPDRDTRRMLAAIDRLDARDVEGDLEASLSLAGSRLASVGGSRRIFVITDGNLARDVALGASVPVEVITVGERAENAAIVRVDVRAGDDVAAGREEVRAFLLVANFGKTARELYVTMRQPGASDTLASRRLEVEPGQKVPVVLTFRPAPGDRGMPLVFELSPHDALALDDVAYGRVPLGRAMPVIIASKGPSAAWLERALAADPDVELRRMELAEASLGGVADDALVVIEGACPAASVGGDLLIVNPPEGACYGARIGKRLEKPQISSWDHADARMRFLSLDGVFVSEARALEAESKRQELVRSEHGAIAVDASTASRFVTLLGFDVASTDWPYKASFVVFARNVLELARQHRGGVLGSLRTGEPLRVAVPPLAAKVTLTRPDATELELTARAGVTVVADVARVGHYRLRWEAPSPAGARAGGVLLPVNLTSASESDLGRVVAAQSPGVTVVTAKAAALGVSEHAPYLVLLALAFIAFDVWYFTRRTRPREAAPRTARAGGAHAS